MNDIVLLRHFGDQKYLHLEINLVYITAVLQLSWACWVLSAKRCSLFLPS